MKQVHNESQIVEGKRKRVMSFNGVMAVLTKELLKETKTSVPSI